MAMERTKGSSKSNIIAGEQIEQLDESTVVASNELFGDTMRDSVEEMIVLTPPRDEYRASYEGVNEGSQVQLSAAAASVVECPPEYFDQEFQTALAMGDVARVDVLIAEGRVDVNKADPDGNPPLCIACRRGDTDVVESLLKAGANAFCTTSSGATAMHLCTMGGFETIQVLMRDAQIAQDNDDNGDGLAAVRWWGKRVCGISLLAFSIAGFFYWVLVGNNDGQDSFEDG